MALPEVRPEAAAAAPPASLRPGGLFGVFRHRNYAIFFAGQLVSLLGTWMQSIAQAWLVWSLTQSEFLLGLTFFAGQAPVFFFALFGGALADRMDRRRLLLITQGLSFVQAVILTLITFAGLVEVWHVIVLAAGLGLLNALDIPARQAFTIELVGRADLARAIALNSIMFNITRIGGPALGGLVVALAGEAVCFALNAASFAGVLGSLLLIRVAARPPRAPSRALADIAEGARMIARHREMRTLLLLLAIAAAAGTPYMTLLPAVAETRFALGPDGLGILISMVGIGALAGGVVLGRLPEEAGGRAPLFAALGYGVMLIAFAISPAPLSAGAALAAIGFTQVLLAAGTNARIQMLVDDHLRGRAMSFFTMAFMGMMPWGGLIAGAAAEWSSKPAVLAGGGVIVLIAAAAAIAVLMRPAPDEGKD